MSHSNKNARFENNKIRLRRTSLRAFFYCFMTRARVELKTWKASAYSARATNSINFQFQFTSQSIILPLWWLDVVFILAMCSFCSLFLLDRWKSTTHKSITNAKCLWWSRYWFSERPSEALVWLLPNERLIKKHFITISSRKHSKIIENKNTCVKLKDTQSDDSDWLTRSGPKVSDDVASRNV